MKNMQKQQGLDKDYADFLAQEVIRQFQEYPFTSDKRMTLDKDKLATIILKAEGFEHKGRMQFIIPKSEDNVFHNPNNRGLILDSFYPRRVFTNEDSSYRPTRGEKMVQGIENMAWEARKVRFNSEVICRDMRTVPEITAIRQRSLELGHKYGLMVNFHTTLNHVNEAPYFGGDSPAYVPLIFIPTATKTDIETLTKFCIKHQNPKDHLVNHYIEEGIFKDYIYTQ